MNNNRMILNLFALVLSLSAIAGADQPQPAQPTQPPANESFKKELQHYEGDMPDALANPLDSTEEELDEEAEEINSLQQPISK